MWNVSIYAVPMPEAAMYENGDTVFFQYYVWRSR